MCGIAGIVAAGGVEHETLERMARVLEHRGPDGLGYLLHQPPHGLAVGGSLESPALAGARQATVGLAHRRLSIIDLSHASDQPMLDATGRHALVYNGEIYNYVELRAELEALGYAFRTDGDTEVVLMAYAAWGPDCVRRFVGMWSFAMLDLDRNCLVLSRDRFGIKPLFYAVSRGSLYFASEIKGLLASGDLSPEPNEDAVRTFLLTARTDASPESFFRGIFHLPAAHNAVIALDRPPDVQPVPYWEYPSESYRRSVPEAAEEFATLFTDAVRLHARADVPVGTCLSGGLDSSAIVCVAERLRAQGQIPHYAHAAFGYVPENPALSERAYMDEVVRVTDLRMTYVRAPAARALEVIPVVARQQDEPFGTASIVAQWFVFEAARRAGLKVMLDGQGADETLGGYLSYLPLVGRALLRNWKFVQFARFAADHRRLLGTNPLSASDAAASAFPALRRLRRGGGPLSPAAAVMSEVLRGEWQSAGGTASRPGSVSEILSERARTLQLPALLRYEDRNSMAHSVEGRVPFLDHRLVEFAFRLPGDFKIRGADTKHILREGLAGVLPEKIRTRRDKVGFAPDPGITRAFAGLHRDALLAGRTEYEDRWFDRTAFSGLMERSRAETEDVLWRVISTKLWLRNHWGDEPRAPIAEPANP